LGKPIAESSALFIPTAIYGVSGGHDIIRKVICGTPGDPFCELGWKSLGVLELAALPSLKQHFWIDTAPTRTANARSNDSSPFCNSKFSMDSARNKSTPEPSSALLNSFYLLTGQPIAFSLVWLLATTVPASALLSE
jgi:hypothetical protein